MSLDSFGGQDNEREQVLNALMDTMRGIAQDKNIQISAQQLRTCAILLTDKAEENNEPIDVGQARSPHTELMEKMKRILEARKDM